MLNQLHRLIQRLVASGATNCGGFAARQLPRIGDSYAITLNGEKPLNNWQKDKDRLDELAGFHDWTLHDLRRTVASGMAKLGVSLVVIEKVLNHVSGSLGGIVGIYQRHEYAEEKRQSLQLWADHVERLVQ
jgi:integrase